MFHCSCTWPRALPVRTESTTHIGKSRGPYAYLGWQHTLDIWLFSVAGFWGRTADTPLAGALVGKGLQLTVGFNH